MNIKVFKTIVLLILSFAYSLPAFSTQEFDVKDGDSIKIILSRTELSHLKFSGEGRISKIWGNKEFIDLQVDHTHGEAFLKAFHTAPAVFSFFVKDDFGSVYNITAVQNNVPAQTIILNAQSNEKIKKHPAKKSKSQPLKIAVNKLLKGMFKDEHIEGYIREEKKEIIPLWKETNINFTRSYQNYAFHGEVYSVKNIGKESIDFHESEFFDFGDAVVAVGIEHLNLKPGNKTRVFVVRRAGSKYTMGDS